MQTPSINDKPQDIEPQKRTVEPKRAYKPRETGLPEGCILASDFARKHGIAPTTFRDHMIIGLGPGVPWGMGNEMTAEKEHVDFSERDHPSRKGEKERYLTPEQQATALEFWKKHDVPYQLPEELPSGSLSAVDFAQKIGIEHTVLEGIIRHGIGRGKAKESLDVTEEDHPTRAGYKLKSFTPEQQEKAIELLKRHGKLEDTTS